MSRKIDDETDPLLPVAPFRAWLCRQSREYTLQQIAAGADVSIDILERILGSRRKKKSVQRWVVDEVLTANGAHIDEIDWDAEILPPKVKPARKRLEPPCPCRCGQRGICEEHRQRLLDIRGRMRRGFYSGSGFPDELEEDAA